MAHHRLHRKKVLTEKERISKLGRVREFVFGTLDGLLVPVGVITAVAGGTGDSKSVIIAGLAEAFAGALSMGAGEFISGRSEGQVQKKEVQKEMDEIKNKPEHELLEMGAFFEDEGVSKEDAQTISTILVKYDHSYKKTMVEKELGLDIHPETVKIPEALTIGVSYIIGSVFPIIGYFFLPVKSALPVSIFLTVVALIIVGLIKGKLAKINLIQSILEIVIVGVISAFGGYFLGTMIPHLFGY